MSARILALACVALLTLPAAAQNQKVSGDLAHDPGLLGGDVEEARFTPDGLRVLYRANQEEVGTLALFSKLVGSSEPAIQLSLDGPENRVDGFRITPDGERVIFWGENLHGAPVDGSSAAVLLGDVIPGSLFAITPDSTEVVFTFGGKVRACPVDGSAAPRTVDQVPPWIDAHVFRMALSPDGQRVVSYRFSDQYLPGVLLTSARLDGSAAVSELVSFVGPGPRLSFAVTPDSQFVVVHGELTEPGGVPESALYRIPIDGGVLTRLTQEHPDPRFEVDPTGAHVVYLVRVAGVDELYSAPLDGGAPPVRLNDPLVQPGDAHSFAITPNGKRVAFLVEAEPLRDLLFSTPIAGGPMTSLDGAMVPGGSVFSFEVSPRSLGVVFSADKLVDGVRELFAVPFGGTAFKIGPATPSVAVNGVFSISPDDTHVVYKGVSEGHSELFSAEILTGTNTRISGPTFTGPFFSSVIAWDASADSSKVVYLFDQEIYDVDEAYVAPIATAGAAVKVNGPLGPGTPVGDVRSFLATPDSHAVLYLADGEVQDEIELWRTCSHGIEPLTVTGADGIQEVRTTAGGETAFYRRDLGNRRDLYRVPVHGGQPPQRLVISVGQYALTSDETRIVYIRPNLGLFVQPATGGTEVRLDVQSASLPLKPVEFWLCADGQTVVYRTAEGVYSNRIDGGQVPVRLNDALGTFTPPAHMQFDGSCVRITPDGARVVFVTDAEVDERFELYSVPADGHGPVYRLNGPLVTGGDVLAFELCQGGARVVYYADQLEDERHELFSVPVVPDRRKLTHVDQRGGGRARLNGLLAPGGRVGGGCCAASPFVLGPDGSQVLFTASVRNATSRDLFVAPVDGSEHARVLATGGNPHDFRFSPDGTHVVFQTTSPRAVHVVPADLASPGLELFPGTGTYRVSDDGAWVVLHADLEQTDRHELWLRRIDCSTPIVRLNDPLPSWSDVGGTYGSAVPPTFLIAPDGSRVVYGADQETDEVHELFATPLPPQ